MRRADPPRGQKAVGALAGAVDRLFNQNVLRAKRVPRGTPEQYLEVLGAFVERWNEPRFFTDSDAFFGVPHVPEVALRRVKLGRSSVAGRVVEDLSFASPHTPHFDSSGAGFDSFPRNGRVPARRILAGPRPSRSVVVLVHGYMGGSLGAEEWVWPLDTFLLRGVDVVLAVLPFHGRRNDRAFGRPPRWPGTDLGFALEGFRQTVADLRALVAWLGHGEGYVHAGMMGMSLGGFATALMATVEPRLAFAVPFIPLASIADWTRDAGHIPGDEAQRARIYQLLEEAHALVSPLSRPLVVPREHCFVAVAERDAITPVSHGARIARHFDVPLEVFPGGHILQAGRGRAFRRLVHIISDVERGARESAG